MMSSTSQTPLQGLYEPSFEHENCGFGLIAQMDDKPSHQLVSTAIESLARMTHRGGVAADCCSGDGCGLLIKKPARFFADYAAQNGLTLAPIYAVGMVFLNTENALADHALQTLAGHLKNKGLSIAGVRDVPVDNSILGAQAKAIEPHIKQVFINAAEGMDEEAFNRALFVARRRTEMDIEHQDAMFYMASLHSQLIAYKGLVMPRDLPVYFKDLNAENFASSVVSYHQRFSTNTMPQWRLAQPFRFLAHNGELNTISGNRKWAIARQGNIHSDLIPELSELKPLVAQSGSDSNSLDNMLEVLMMGGTDIFRSMRMMIPPAWQNVPNMDPELRAFFEYNSMHMEPWDGPAGMVIHNGRFALCGLDRNGLRPTRYVITKDRHITFASEIGVYDYDPMDVVQKGKLKPGQLMAVDLETGTLLSPEEIDAGLKSRKPYLEWLKDNYAKLETVEAEDEDSCRMSAEDSLVYQKYFQVSFEERDAVIRVLAESGQEATVSMGDDAPIPVLSRNPRVLYDSFRQMFAQVTNPPIDPLREAIVMSLNTCFGRELNIFEETKEHAMRLESTSPILSPSMFRQLINFDTPGYAHVFFSLNYNPSEMDLKSAIRALCDAAVSAVKQGKTILVLSDKDIEPELLTIHALMATGAVHHRLIEEGLRCHANIVVETATARDPHHFAVLFGYGATAVYPYLAYEILGDMMRTKELTEAHLSKYLQNFRKGIAKGLYKILSKMGISTLASYRGAQLFEAVGVSSEVVNLCFKGTVTRIEGINFAHLQTDNATLAKLAFNARKSIKQGGVFKYVHGGEDHAYNPDVVNALRDAVQTGDQAKYNHFRDLVNHRKPIVLRDLLKLKTTGITPISIDEVEPMHSILKRFDSAGISLGALSPEAHEAIAIAMNRLGARSNSGEGGEDNARYGTEKMSKIKQIASGRFGVTPHYLVNAEVLQIKVAQGAKPGEGGQLPGHKVDEYIGKLRHATPGVTLISPPPHHDIYSIEDLAQLIYDLKQVNPEALISVKLVSAPGVGTVAAGVAKAYADLITISGYDGGTGASPMTSVKYAGNPFELGLAEAHQVLRANDLRGNVLLQADGGLKTGLDVIKACLLGAESFGFGTAPMITLGCKYLRICHLNTCAVGVATQDARLRKEHFIGMPEMVMNYFRFLVEETREIMASLGARTLEELVGRVDLLELADPVTAKQANLDLSRLISDGGVPKHKPQTCQIDRNRPWDTGSLAEQMIEQIRPSILKGQSASFNFHLINTARSIGARISGEIARHHGAQGMTHQPIRLNLTGIAGQSFGVWNAPGLHMYLQGDANDYVGKGMAGGRLVITPPKGSAFIAKDTPIVGNTCLYGATQGTLYADGRAGERFAVRNSGATAMVTGMGDHGCEYMTGGLVISLGSVGLNFGAGMSGGYAMIYDAQNTLPDTHNNEMVEICRITCDETENFRTLLKQMLEDYQRETHSTWAQELLNNFSRHLAHFWLVKPKTMELERLWKMTRKQTD